MVSTVTDLLYTGQKLDSHINLYWYGSRWYDNGLERFIQPDSLVPNPEASWAYDRYSYVGNNPLSYTDPTGHKKVPGGPGGVTIVYDDDDDQPDVFDYPYLWIPGIGGSNINYGNPYFAEKGESEEFIDGIREGTKYELAVAGFIVGTYGTSYLFSNWIIEVGATATAIAEKAAEAACRDGDCTNEISSVSNGVQEFTRVVPNLTQRGLVHVRLRHWPDVILENVSRFRADINIRMLKAFIKLSQSPVNLWRQEVCYRVRDFDTGQMVGYTMENEVTNWLRVVINSAQEVISSYPIDPIH